MKYPVNVTPHMITVDATKQQGFTFDFYGNDLAGLECDLYDGITNEHLNRYYCFGRTIPKKIVEESSSVTLNMQRMSCNFGQINTSSYVLENNKKYKYVIRTAQTKVNQFVFQGGITGLINNQQFLVVANPLLHSPRSYQNDFIKFGFYLAIDIGNERKNVVAVDFYDGINYLITLDSPFNQNLLIGTQYRVYSNYITSPEYTFKTKKDPVIDIVNLEDEYLENGGSAWYCSFEQEDNLLIKSYNWKLNDMTQSKSDIYTGLVLRPQDDNSIITKTFSAEQSLTTKKSTKYIITGYDQIEQESTINETNVYLRVVWSSILGSDFLTDDDGSYCIVHGSFEHIYPEESIRLNKSDFKKISDSGTDELICYVTGFTVGFDETTGTCQEIKVDYYNTFGEKIGTCYIGSEDIEFGGFYEFKITQKDDNVQAKLVDMSVVEISTVLQSLVDKSLVITVQDKQYSSFNTVRKYLLGANQNLKVSWNMIDSIKVEDDENYTSGFSYNSQSIYIDTGLENVIGKQIYIEDSTIDGNSRLILDYNSSTGLVTLNNGYYRYPSENAKYHIFIKNDSTLIETKDFYKINTFYRNNYLAIDKKIMGNIFIKTEENSVFYASKTISFPTSEKDENGNLINILAYLDENNNIIQNDTLNIYPQIKTNYNSNNNEFLMNWCFKNGYINNNQMLFIYREEENRIPIDLMLKKSISENNINNIMSFTDYTVANNIKYRYIIIVQSKDTGDIVGEYQYKYYKFITDWYSNNNTSWIISGLEKQDFYLCEKQVYKINDSWQLYVNVQSDDIVQNINTQVYSSYNQYPKIIKIGNNNYISGSLSVNLATIDCNSDEFIDNIQKVNAWRKFITKYDSYILRSDKGDIWHVGISDNPSTSYSDTLETTIKFSYTQIGDIHDIIIEK